MSKNDKFWTEDISVLYNMDEIFDIIPNNNMTRDQQLNSITRFCLYFIILLYLTENDSEWIKLPVIVIIFVVILYYIYKNDNDSKFKEFFRIKKNKNELKSSKKSHNENYNEEYSYKKENMEEERDYNLKVYNSLEDEKKSEEENRINKLKRINYTREEIEDFENNNCRIPTKNNPFMNISHDELNKPNIPEACNADDEKIKDDIDNKFNDDIFRDIDDLYNIKNSQRQFYTIPVSNYMPDTKKFAEWCYKMPLNCKSNQESCLKYEDLKYK